LGETREGTSQGDRFTLGEDSPLTKQSASVRPRKNRFRDASSANGPRGIVQLNLKEQFDNFVQMNSPGA